MNNSRYVDDGDTVAVTVSLLGKDVLDIYGRQCGVVGGVHDVADGSTLVEVQFRTLLGKQKQFLVPCDYFLNLSAPVLKLSMTLAEFKDQIWIAHDQYLQNYYEPYPGYTRCEFDSQSRPYYY